MQLAMIAPLLVTFVEGKYRAPMVASRIDSRGAFVQTDLLFEKGECLPFEIELPGGGRIEGTAEVRGLLTKGAVRGMMLEFFDLDESDSRALAAVTSEG